MSQSWGRSICVPKSCQWLSLLVCSLQLECYGNIRGGKVTFCWRACAFENISSWFVFDSMLFLDLLCILICSMLSWDRLSCVRPCDVLYSVLWHVSCLRSGRWWRHRKDRITCNVLHPVMGTALHREQSTQNTCVLPRRDHQPLERHMAISTCYLFILVWLRVK